MKVTPLHNKILVRIETAAERKVGNLIIPGFITSVSNNQVTGLVISVGKGRLTSTGRLPAPAVKPGDKVLLNKFAGTRFMIEGKLFMVVFANEVICVIEDDEE